MNHIIFGLTIAMLSSLGFASDFFAHELSTDQVKEKLRQSFEAGRPVKEADFEKAALELDGFCLRDDYPAYGKHAKFEKFSDPILGWGIKYVIGIDTSIFYPLESDEFGTKETRQYKAQKLRKNDAQHLLILETSTSNLESKRVEGYCWYTIK